MLKELPLSFEGVGEVKGYVFRQLHVSSDAYIYEKKNVDTGLISYEVFRRKENDRFGCVSYPSSKSFGKWAWECVTYQRALNRFFDLNMSVKCSN